MSKQSKNLLREAIADAKQVRETALANAKAALEEAFTPHLSSMLATKLRNEEDAEEEDLDEIEDKTPAADGHGSDEGGETDVQAVEKSTFNEDAEVKSDAAGYKSSDIGTESPDHSYGTSDPKDPAASTRQTAAPVLDNKGQETMGEAEDPELDVDVADDATDGMEPDADDAAAVEPVVGDEEPEEEGRDMDLESIIRELEADIEDDDDEDDREPAGDPGGAGLGGEAVEPEMDTDVRQELDPEDADVTEGSAGTQQTDAVADGHGSDEGGETDAKATVDSTFKESKNARLRKENDEEDVDLEEILREIEDEEEEEKSESAVAKLTAELKEYRTAVKFLRSKLNEVNLLNAKLLYTNRLFRDYSMDVRSKMRVVENFDRATTVREAKLVYATIAESFRGKSGVTRKVRQSITEGLASKKSGSTASRRAVDARPVDENTPTILREGVDLAARFKKLAGIK